MPCELTLSIGGAIVSIIKPRVPECSKSLQPMDFCNSKRCSKHGQTNCYMLKGLSGYASFHLSTMLKAIFTCSKSCHDTELYSRKRSWNELLTNPQIEFPELQCAFADSNEHISNEHKKEGWSIPIAPQVVKHCVGKVVQATNARQDALENTDAQHHIVVSIAWKWYFKQPVQDKMCCQTQLLAQRVWSTSIDQCNTRCTAQCTNSAYQA